MYSVKYWTAELRKLQIWSQVLFYLLTIEWKKFSVYPLLGARLYNLSTVPKE